MTEGKAMTPEHINLDANIDDTLATRPVEIDELKTLGLTESLMLQAPQPRRSGYCISLYLPATRDPIEIWNQPNVTLGRPNYRDNVFPDIDLTEHYAAKLGVSRLHARIFFKGACFFVQDLGSKNGTWVNNRRLEEGECELLTHHDTLRLSHLIILVGACQYS
jgi:hypothetical protein